MPDENVGYTWIICAMSAIRSPAWIAKASSWISSPELMRSAERDAYNGYYRVNVVGFRVTRDD